MSDEETRTDAPATVLEVVAWTAEGAARPRAVRLPSDPFDGRVHKTAMHDAVKSFLANQRQGTAMTKTRGFVSGGNQKPWKQKGTGRARQGSTRAPNWPGGGKVFGPVPRDYRFDLPKKVRRLARASALNARAKDGSLQVIAPLAIEEPKTRRIAELLGKVGADGERVLLLLAEHKPNVVKSARNIPNVEVLRYGDVSTYDVLRAQRVLVEETALGGQLESGAEVSVAVPESRKAKRAKRAEERHAAAAAAEAEAPPAGEAPKKKTAAKKAAAKKASARAAAKPAAKKAPAKAAKNTTNAAEKTRKKPGKKKS